MADRRFLSLAVGLSLLGHLVVFRAALVRGLSSFSKPLATRFKLVYEERPAGAVVRPMPQVAPTVPVRYITIPTLSAGASAAMRGGAGVQLAPSAESVGDQALLLALGNGEGMGGMANNPLSVGGGAVVDLANVAASARGNPVRLTYFSALRDQVQQMANSRAWIPEAAAAGGIAYVRFVLERRGTTSSIELLVEQSTASPALGDAAVRIVRAAGPFPPFPPSFTDSTLTILIPIQFVFGSPE